MSDYFIKYKNLAIYAEESRKLVRPRNYRCKVVDTDADVSFDNYKTKNPYAQCVKLTIENLDKLLPHNLKLGLQDLPEVQSLIREEKINKIIDND